VNELLRWADRGIHVDLWVSSSFSRVRAAYTRLGF